MGDSKLARLASEARAGDASKMRPLLRGVAPTILRTARRIMGDPTEAEDIAQDALIQFNRDFASLRDHNAVEAFAARLTARLAIRARQRYRKQAAVTADIAAQRAVEEPIRLTDPATQRETAEQMLAVLDELSPEQSETLILRYFMGHSLEEVAAATGVPQNTVRSRVRLARQSIARVLAEDPRFGALKEVLR